MKLEAPTFISQWAKQADAPADTSLLQTVWSATSHKTASNHTPPAAAEQGAGPEDVYAALQRSAQLRTVLMAAEPEAGGLLTRQGSYRQAPERGGAAGRVLALLTESIGSMATAP